MRRLSKFLADEMLPVPTRRGEIWRWNLHPGAGVLTLPWPRHWTFRRKAARDDDAHPFRDHVIVGSWKIAPGPLTGGSPPPRQRPTTVFRASVQPFGRAGKIRPGFRAGSRSCFCRLN